jgi:hypothetical protein
MDYSHAPNRPRIPDALLKTEGGGEFRRRRRRDIFNFRIRQSGVREKFQYAGLDSGSSCAFKYELQKPGSLVNSRGTDEGSKLISIPVHYAART